MNMRNLMHIREDGTWVWRSKWERMWNCSSSTCSVRFLWTLHSSFPTLCTNWVPCSDQAKSLRHITVQFTSRSHREKICQDARTAATLQLKKIRILEDFAQATKDARNKLWSNRQGKTERKQGSTVRLHTLMVKIISGTDMTQDTRNIYLQFELWCLLGPHFLEYGIQRDWTVLQVMLLNSFMLYTLY